MSPAVCIFLLLAVTVAVTEALSNRQQARLRGNMAAALDRLTAHQQRQRQRNNARPAGNRYLIFRPSRRQQLPKGSQLIDKLQQNRQLHNFYHPDTLQQALGYRPESLPDNAFFRRSRQRKNVKLGKTRH